MIERGKCIMDKERNGYDMSVVVERRSNRFGANATSFKYNGFCEIDDMEEFLAPYNTDPENEPNETFKINPNLEKLCEECWKRDCNDDEYLCEYNDAFIRSRCFDLTEQSWIFPQCPYCNSSDFVGVVEYKVKEIHDVRIGGRTSMLRVKCYEYRCSNPEHGRRRFTPVLDKIQAQKRGEMTPRLICAVVDTYISSYKPKMVAEGYGISVASVNKLVREYANVVENAKSYWYLRGVTCLGNRKVKGERPAPVRPVVAFVPIQYRGLDCYAAIRTDPNEAGEQIGRVLDIYKEEDCDKIRAMADGEMFCGCLPAIPEVVLSCMIYDYCAYVRRCPGDLDYYAMEVAAAFVRAIEQVMLNDRRELEIRENICALLDITQSEDVQLDELRRLADRIIEAAGADERMHYVKVRVEQLKEAAGYVLDGLGEPLASSVADVRMQIESDSMWWDEKIKQMRRLFAEADMTFDDMRTRLLLVNEAVIWHVGQVDLSDGRPEPDDLTVRQRGIDIHCMLHLLQGGILREDCNAMIPCQVNLSDMQMKGYVPMCDGRRCPMVHK